MTLIPRAQTPELSLPTVGGGRFTLSADHGDFGTMVVFYRGLHCPICHKQLKALADMLQERQRMVTKGASAEQLAKYKVPKHWELRKELPKSSMMKLLRRVLRDESPTIVSLILAHVSPAVSAAVLAARGSGRPSSAGYNHSCVAA